MLILITMACFLQEPNQTDDKTDFESQAIIAAIQPWEIGFIERIDELLKPCSPIETGFPEEASYWEGLCNYEHIQIEGSIEIQKDWLLAKDFSIHVDQQRHMYLDGSIEWIEYDDLLRIESSIQSCNSISECQAPVVLQTLTKTIYPFSSYPERYETNISGLLVSEKSVRIDATWEFDSAICQMEPIIGFIGIGEYELQLDGYHFCDNCGNLYGQGFPLEENCSFFQNKTIQ
jgi:hypothetical protein